MRNTILSERTKDKLLNIALVCSATVLLGGFVHQTPVKKGTSPVQNNYTTYQVQPVAMKELPMYEPVGELPSSSVTAPSKFPQQVTVNEVLGKQTQPANGASIIQSTSKPTSQLRNTTIVPESLEYSV